MKFKKEIIASLFILASTPVLADPVQPILHITPEVLAAQQGIVLPWNVSSSESAREFNFSNETNAPIKISLQVVTEKFSPNVSLYLSSTGSSCAWKVLQPKEVIDCVVEPEGYLGLSYNDNFAKNPEPISGNYILSANSE